MAQDNAGLELPIGLTEQKFMQSLARIEANAIRSVKRAEQGFVRGNQQIADSFSRMSKQSTGNLQNVSYQLQDIFVQIQGGQGVTRALSQQLPQLLSGFGALGAVLGTAAALAVPLASSLLGLGEETEKLADATGEAEKALKAWEQASADASLIAQELAARYGEAQDAARELLQLIATTAEAKAILAQKDALDAVSEAYGGLIAEVHAYKTAVESGNQMELVGWGDQFAEDFGLALDQAVRLAEIIEEINSTNDADRRNSLLKEMGELLNEAVNAGCDVSVELLNMTDEAGRTALAAAQIGAGLSGAAADAANLAVQLSNVAAAANSAAAALGAAGIFVGGDGSMQRTGRKNYPSTDWRFEDPGKDYDTLKERRAREAEANAQAAEAAARRAAASGGGGGGGRKRSGGGSGGRSARTERPFFENIEKDLTNLERQIELIGKSERDVAKLKATWELLDAAKKRGIEVDAALNAKIEEQAGKFADLTVQLEQQKLSYDEVEQRIDGIADTIADVVLEGESLRETLANVMKGIARDIMTSGIRDALKAQLGGGGGSWWQQLIGRFIGGGDPLTGALRGVGLPARANGGPVSAGQPYMVGERGPEPFVPAVNGRILSVAQAQAAIRGRSGGAHAGNVNIDIDVTGATGNQEVQRMVAAGVQQGMNQVRREVPDIMSNHQKWRG